MPADAVISPVTNAPTRVAVLGTLTEFQQKPIPVDTGALVELVTDIAPDLLCLDMTPEQWANRDFGGLPPEYRDALLPLAEQSDIVVVPVGTDAHDHEPAAHGWRGALIGLLRKGIAAIQRSAPGPDALNYGWRHDVANHLYNLTLRLAGEKAHHSRSDHTLDLIRQVAETAHRDPGTRVLVVVNVQHCHHIRPALDQYADIEVVRYDEL